MLNEGVTLRLIDLGVVYGGVGYLILAAAVMHLALRCRSRWLMLSAVCFALLSFVKLSAFAWGMLLWHGMLASDAESPAAVQLVAGFDSALLLVGAMAVAIFAMISSRKRTRSENGSDCK